MDEALAPSSAPAMDEVLAAALVVEMGAASAAA